jgi:hypothetical protein
MAKEKEYEGLWWLPNRPAATLQGTLRFKPNEYAILDLLGSFPILGTAGVFEIPLIVGRCFVSSSERELSSKEEEITLKNCSVRNISLDFRRPSSYDAQTIFIGYRFDKEMDVKFKEVYIKYSYLHEWVGISGFNVDKNLDENKVEMNYQTPDPIALTEIGDFKISICFVPLPSLLQLRLALHARQQVQLKQETYIKIESDEDKPYEEYLDLIRKLQNFLSLVIMQPVYPLYVDGGNSSKKLETQDGRVILLPIQIMDRHWHIFTPPKGISSLDMLFSLRWIETKIGDLIKKWIEEYDEFSSVYNPYFGTMYSGEIYLEDIFLALIRTIEGYHRLTHKIFESEDDEKAYQEKVKNIIESVKEKDYKDWLTDELKYSYEPKLRKRLNDLIAESSEVTKFLFKRKKDMKNFINKVVEARNFLIHPDTRLKAVDYSSYLPELIQDQMKPLIAILLFKQLEFSDYEIKRAMSNHRLWGSKFKD